MKFGVGAYQVSSGEFTPSASAVSKWTTTLTQELQQIRSTAGSVSVAALVLRPYRTGFRLTTGNNAGSMGFSTVSQLKLHHELAQLQRIKYEPHHDCSFCKCQFYNSARHHLSVSVSGFNMVQCNSSLFVELGHLFFITDNTLFMKGLNFLALCSTFAHVQALCVATTAQSQRRSIAAICTLCCSACYLVAVSVYFF